MTMPTFLHELKGNEGSVKDVHALSVDTSGISSTLAPLPVRPALSKAVVRTVTTLTVSLGEDLILRMALPA
jgi:hypothetical protein